MRLMLALVICTVFTGCGGVPQPQSAKTVAAFEVPLPSESDREQFLSVLRAAAASAGMHVDAMSKGELQASAAVSSNFNQTMRAAVWVGSNDVDSVAVASDQSDHLGQVWIMFLRGEDPALATQFRETAMRAIMLQWPDTLSLPIMPSGSIPLHQDLLREGNGYVVNPSQAHRYERLP
jgi:hypothetical protein